MRSSRQLRAIVAIAASLASCTRPAAKPGDTARASTDSTAAPAPGASAAPAPPRADSAAPPARAESLATPTPGPQVTPSETVLTGTVVAGGLASTPITSLQIEGGKPTRLIGPLEPELRRLGSATVWVAGTPATRSSFTVSRYEIVSIDGAKPLIGIVTTRGGTSSLATQRDTLTLDPVPADLAARTGAKVWIVGRQSGTKLAVQSYGVIKEG